MDALFHEGPERRNTGSGANHDDVRVLVFRENEGFCWRHEHADGGTGGIDFVGHELGAQSTASSSVVFEADDTHGQFHKAGVSIVGRSDGIEPGLEAVGQFKEFLGGVLHLKFSHDVHVIAGPKIILNGLGVRRDGLDLSRWVVGWNRRTKGRGHLLIVRSRPSVLVSGSRNDAH